jgi:hypothetical protein
LYEIWQGRNQNDDQDMAICNLRSTFPKNAIWRNTLFTQPPNEHLVVEIGSHFKDNHRTIYRFTAGSYTLGDIMDKMLESIMNDAVDYPFADTWYWTVRSKPEQY